jgi:hypothetical protein
LYLCIYMNKWYSNIRNAVFSISLNTLLAIYFIAGVLHDATFHAPPTLQCHDERTPHFHNEQYGSHECSSCVFTLIGLDAINPGYFIGKQSVWTDLVAPEIPPYISARFKGDYPLRGPPSA